MQITLNHEEILVALKDYAAKIINIAPGNDITIDLKAGRGENGYSATLDIVPQQLTSSHEPKGPNTFNRTSGSVEGHLEPHHGILRDVSDVKNDPAIVPELPVAGEDMIDTKPTEPEVIEDVSEAEAEQAVDEYLEGAGAPTKSLFARN